MGLREGECGRVSDFKGRHFEGEIVLWAVRWYCRYGVSYRDLEQMLGERGVSVDHSTIYRWVQRYAPEIEKRLRWLWRRPRSTSWRTVPFHRYDGVVADDGPPWTIVIIGYLRPGSTDFGASSQP